MATVLLAVGCNSIKEKDYPGEVSTTICDQIYDCNCDSTLVEGATKDQCKAAIKEGAELRGESARVDGLEYDGKCAAEQVNDINDRACDPPDFNSDPKCEKPCKLYHGPVEKGGSCSISMSGFDNCAQGLTCDNDGICTNPCAEVDYPKVGETCFAGLCEEGAYCSQNALTNQPTCTAYPGNGQPCLNGSECAEGLVCDNSTDPLGICATLPGTGQPCLDGECAEGLFCDFQADPTMPTCSAPAGLGQDCSMTPCAFGLLCNPDTQVCENYPAAICGAWTPLPPINP